MSLRKIMVNELLSGDLTLISKDDLADVNKYITQMLLWCSDLDISICAKFLETLKIIVDTLAKLRLMKVSANSGVNEQSFDYNLLNELMKLVSKYYRVLMLGLSDPNGNVLVKVINDMEVRGRSFRRGVVTLTPLVDAVFLECLGFVKILDDIIPQQYKGITTP